MLTQTRIKAASPLSRVRFSPAPPFQVEAEQALVLAEIERIESEVSYPTLSQLVHQIRYCDDFGGNDTTRRKNTNDLVDLLSRTDIDMEEDIRVLTRKIGAKTLPEYWEKYDLPHKLRRVCSIFSKRNIKLLKQLEWDVECFSAFVTYTPLSPAIEPFCTDDSEVALIREKCANLASENPEWHKIYLLAFSAGLRASEIYQVRFSHLKVVNGQFFIFLPFATKRQKLKGTNFTEKVGIPKATFDALVSYQDGDPESLIVGTLNRQKTHRAFLDFLRDECGFADVKACHRLRKILGARMATQVGIYHAAKQLRNGVQVAEKYYSDLVAHQNDLEV